MSPSNPLYYYLGERAPLPLLTHTQEVDLARRVSAGRSAARLLARRSTPPQRRRALRQTLAEGMAAREALVLHNLPLVLSVAGRFRNSALDYQDLIQEGILGLIKAAEKYDPGRGTRFGTLAVWWIRQSIGRAVANHGRTVRLPVNRGWRVSQLRRVAAQLAQQIGDEPTLDMVAQTAGMSPQAAAAWMRDGQPVISLDAAPADPDDRNVLERMADTTAVDPESAVVENSLTRMVRESLEQLDEREAEVLRLRFRSEEHTSELQSPTNIVC